MRSLRSLMRTIVGPLAVAIFGGIALSGWGLPVAALFAYGAFVGAQLAVMVWSRWQLHRARARLAAARARRGRAVT